MDRWTDTSRQMHQSAYPAKFKAQYMTPMPPHRPKARRALPASCPRTRSTEASTTGATVCPKRLGLLVNIHELTIIYIYIYLELVKDPVLDTNPAALQLYFVFTSKIALRSYRSTHRCPFRKHGS